MDASADVRREVCIGLVKGLQHIPQRLEPYLQKIIEYMLESNQHAVRGEDGGQPVCGKGGAGGN